MRAGRSRSAWNGGCRIGELDELSGRWAPGCSRADWSPARAWRSCCPTCRSSPVTMCGVLRAGYTCVNVNPLYTARELEHQLKDSGATAIVILENFAATLEQVIEQTPIKHVVVASMGDLLGGLLRHAGSPWPCGTSRRWCRPTSCRSTTAGPSRPFPRRSRRARGRTLGADPSTLDSIAFLQYTGGTTGLSKGAVLTHRNIVAATLQAEAWFTPALERAGDLSQGQQHRGAAAVSHLRADAVPARDPPGFAPDADPQSARLRQVHRGAQEAALPHAAGGEHAVQRAAACIRNSRPSTSRTLVRLAGRRHGGFGRHRPQVVRGHGLPDDRRLGHERDLRDRHQQPGRRNTAFTGTIGLPLPGIEIAIKDDEGRSLPLGEAGRALHQGAQRDDRLLQPARRDRDGVHRRRLHAHGRHRRDAGGRLQPRSSIARRT